LAKDVAVDKAAATVAEYQNLADQAKETVDAATYAGIMTCDANGVTIKSWAAECNKGDVEAEFTAKWGVCSKAGESWVIVTGATALKAAAIAMVAFAGSQF